VQIYKPGFQGEARARTANRHAQDGVPSVPHAWNMD
jgi:hypothetical protein